MLVSSRFGQRVYNHVKRMEKSEYIILLERFLKGETTHDEERILVDWFKSDVSRDELRNYIQRKWEIASNSSIPTDLKERMFRKIQSRIESVAVEKKEVGRFSLRNIMRYAAIGLLVICAGLGGHLLTRYSRSVGAEKDYLVFAAKGQKASVVLPDGSKVWLNSDSEIKYTNLYGDGERIISLDGEAYFEVAADPDRLFVVEGGGVVVKVHGTVFNMKAREKQDHVDVSLLSGLVVVENHGVSRSLNPGETAVCKKSVPSIEKKTTDVSISCLWAKESLRFEKKTIYELTGYLSEWYGMDIRLDPSLPTDQAYTFTITHESLEEVLCLIAKITPIEYVFDEDNTVRITRK